MPTRLRALLVFLAAASASTALAADFSFTPPVVTALPEAFTPTSIRLADLDGDGKLDAVVTGRNWDGEPDTFGHVAILKGAADGSFALFSQVAVPQGSSEDAAIADLDGDGKKDLVFTVSSARGRLAKAKGKGDGTFEAPVFIDLERQPRGLTLVDLDGDSDLDVAAVNYYSGSVMVARNDGGTLTLAGTRRVNVYTGAIPYPTQVTGVEVSGDGKADLIVTALGAGRVSVSKGNATTAPPPTVDWKPAPINEETPAVVGGSVADFNNDGRPDVALPVLLVTQSQKVVTLQNDGSGGYANQAVFDSAWFNLAWCSTPIDIDHDGRLDLAIGTAISGSVIFMRNETTGPGQAIKLTQVPVFVLYGYFVRDLTAADVDGDGDQDLVGVEIAGSTIFTLLNTTTAGAPDAPAGQPAKRKPVPPRPTKQTFSLPSDRNQDGRRDAIDLAHWLEAWNSHLKAGAKP